LPLGIFAREGFRTPNVLRWCAVGAALGSAFMFAEMGFMQFLSLYLEGPGGSLPVVLAGLLISAGVGAVASQRLKSRMNLPRSLWACALAVLLWFWLAGRVTGSTFPWSFYSRCLISFLLVFPVGLFLGSPLVRALEGLGDRSRALIPWFWGVTG